MKLVAEVNRKAEEQKKKAAEEEVLKRDAAEAAAGFVTHTPPTLQFACTYICNYNFFYCDILRTQQLMQKLSRRLPKRNLQRGLQLRQQQVCNPHTTNIAVCLHL
jgi:hypothetical protein